MKKEYKLTLIHNGEVMDTLIQYGELAWPSQAKDTFVRRGKMPFSASIDLTWHGFFPVSDPMNETGKPGWDSVRGVWYDEGGAQGVRTVDNEWRIEVDEIDETNRCEGGK